MLLTLMFMATGCVPGSAKTAALELATTPTIAPSPTSAALKPFVPTQTPLSSPTSTMAPPATMTPIPTVQPAPTLEPTLEPAAVATMAPTATAVPATVATTAPLVATLDLALTLNGIPFNAIAVLPPDVVANVQAIYQHGQELGRDPRRFSKLGDSLVLTDHYLTRFDSGGYNLGPYAALQPTIDAYAGSWSRYGVAARVGLYADFATRPGLADGDWCPAEEHMMACEFRLHNPSVMLIRVGTNDVIAASAFETALHRIVEYSIANGVIPVLGTKADRYEGDNRNNEIIRKVAADYKIPLWDFDLVAGTLPDRGLSGDNAHLTVYKHDDYTDPATLQAGYPVSDLSALIVLNALRAVLPTP